jgi:hypothetical protein
MMPAGSSIDIALFRRPNPDAEPVHNTPILDCVALIDPKLVRPGNVK